MPIALLALSLALIFFGREYYVITGKLFNPGDKKNLDHSGYDFGLVVVASLLAQLWTGAAASRLAEPQNQARSVGLVTQLDISRCTPRLAFVHSRWASGSGRGVSIFLFPRLPKLPAMECRSGSCVRYLQSIATRDQVTDTRISVLIQDYQRR